MKRAKMTPKAKRVMRYGLVCLAIIVFLVGLRFAWIYLFSKRIHGNPKGLVGRFNDVNTVQLSAAKSCGIEPIADRDEAEGRVGDLEKISDCSNYKVAYLDYSIPYLTKGGKALLDKIGEDFADSLSSRGIVGYRLIVTSLLRTKNDVKRLRASGNKNASANSAHCYATTFDITYTRYDKKDVSSFFSNKSSADSDALTEVLANVLGALRSQGKCYVKYETHQTCFHLTSRITE